MAQRGGEELDDGTCMLTCILPAREHIGHCYSNLTSVFPCNLKKKTLNIIILPVYE